MARAQTLLLLPTTDLAGGLWTPEGQFLPPPSSVRKGQASLYRFGDGPWRAQSVRPPGADRTQIWLPRHPIIDNEDPTAFQLAASAADVTNLVLNWGDRGIEYINADVTLSLARLPDGDGIGLAATQRLAADGIAVGHGVAFDGHGAFGTLAISALANANKAVRTIRP